MVIKEPPRDRSGQVARMQLLAVALALALLLSNLVPGDGE